ncbi:uncharacterized protein LOC141715001 [Apium graveolens]|uniref:uncharacterized protein LOC141715001 n=1 Tax=Apium graveolens TaxID=4045 RepID=UPI003D794580
MAPPTQGNHNSSSANNTNKKPTARTFNMTLKDVIADNDVIACTLLVNSADACVLIDSGATRTFISENFANKVGLKLMLLDENMMVEILNQEVIYVSQVCPNCTIEIQGKPFVTDLIPLKLGEFDVILGMDWLTRYDAQINCRLKRVSLKDPDTKRVILRGQKQTRKFLTMLQAKRMLHQGCQAYLAHVIDTEKSTPKLEEIPVLSKFKDVFPEDLPGLFLIEKSSS